MFKEFALSGGINFFIVFLEGILSFFSPCVIPLIPIYMAYLAGNTKDEDYFGKIIYSRKKVLFHTLCFVLGISTAFFILGLAFTALGSFFNNNKMLFTRLGGILIIVLGLFQLGIIEFKFLLRERKIYFNLGKKNVNPLIAYFMGFTFSFGWTPCVGPALSSVLILASSAKTTLIGNLLVLLYALGFVLPFILLGLFTTRVLNFLQTKKHVVKYATKVGGLLLVIIGIMTFTGWMNGISSYLNSISDNSSVSEELVNEDPFNENEVIEDEKEENTDIKPHIDSFDFTLLDQYGNKHTLSDYN